MASVLENLEQKILNSDVSRLNENPYGTRFTFINNEEKINEFKTNQNEVWYNGDSNELGNFYRSEKLVDLPSDFIYLENVRKYFWAQAITEKEANFKKVHSGLPHAIINTIVNNIGDFKITSDNKDLELAINKLLQYNNYLNLINQRQLPLTLAVGTGAMKIVIDNKYAYPLIEFYSSKDCKIIYQYNQLVGIIFIDYYKVNNKNYVLYDTRFTRNGNSYIHYELYKLNEKEPNLADRVNLSELSYTANLQDLVLENYDKVLGEPSIFFNDTKLKGRGRSLFEGCIDRFDELDQAMSISGRAVKTSSPVEYYRREALGRDKLGNPTLPSQYDRNYVELESIPNSDGVGNGASVFTTQPSVNTQQYEEYIEFLVNMILIGLLSPATMGFNLSRKDNADAQREKEKITQYLRKNVVEREIIFSKSLITKLLETTMYMKTGVIEKGRFDNQFSIVYDDFYSPSFEQKIQYLSTAFVSGAMSPQKYVETLWGDKLTEQEKLKEIEYLEKNIQQDNLNLDEFLADERDKAKDRNDLPKQV